MVKFNKNNSKSIQKYRFLIQAIFLVLCIWIGIEFHFFVKNLESGNLLNQTTRPPGVEGFLPISALMSVYYFILSGQIHGVHPAGFFIFIAIISVSLIFGKAFCSWICPIGFISEMIGDFGEKIQKKLFKRKLRIPRWLDFPLRSLKYLLLMFFVYAIFFKMTETALRYFLDSPYNIVSDIKMYYFFVDISKFSLIVISVLFLFSVIIRNFWCRYLCPYGALLGITSLLSPNKIKRNKTSCIDCGLCNKSCPSLIKIDKVKTVVSDECTTCLSCVDACPVADTLELKPVFSKKKISKIKVAFGIILIFLSITGTAMLSGNWQNEISQQEYLIQFENINKIGHPTSTKDIDKLNAVSETGDKQENQTDFTN